jgi:hypothetical protein
MSNYLNLQIPVFAAYLDTAFFNDKLPNVENERVPVEVFVYTSIPQRCGMFSVMTEYGSQHARVPIHYLRSKKEAGTDFPLDWLQLWDSYSYFGTCSVNEYTKNRAAKIILKNKSMVKVKYLFTIDWCWGLNYQLGYSEMSAGHKCGHFFEGDGQYFLQPNNRVLWMDGGSFISKTFDQKPNWKVFSKEFSCENTGSRWISESNEELFFYEFKEKNDQE